MITCQGLTGEAKVVRRYGLVNPSTLRPVYFKNQADKSKLRQADIEISFKLITRTSPHSTQKSVERIARSVPSLAFYPILGPCAAPFPFTVDVCLPDKLQTSPRHSVLDAS